MSYMKNFLVFINGVNMREQSKSPTCDVATCRLQLQGALVSWDCFEVEWNELHKLHCDYWEYFSLNFTTICNKTTRVLRLEYKRIRNVADLSITECAMATAMAAVTAVVRAIRIWVGRI